MPLQDGYTWAPPASHYEQVEPSREELDNEKAFDPTAKWDWQNPDKLGPQGEAMPKYAIGWKPNGEADFGAGFTGWLNKFNSKVETAFNRGYEEGLSISGFTKFAEGVKANTSTNYVLGTEEGQAEAAQNKQAALEQIAAERKPKDTKQALLFASLEAGKEAFTQTIMGALEGLGAVSVTAEQVIGSTAYAIADTIKGKDINWQRNWEASRALYAGVFDAAVFSEMERRLDAGMRGDLAEMEVIQQNPNLMWAQMAGQIIFDPLNALSVLGKAGQQIEMVRKAQKGFRTVENPVVREIIEKADDISKLDDARSYQKIDDLVKTQQGLMAVRAHADDILTAEGKLDELSKSYRLSSLTSSGKISHLANETGEIIMHVANNAGPANAADIFAGMVKSVSKDPEVAAEGLAAMMHFTDAPALFSQAGNDTTVLLSRLMEKHGDTLLETISKLKNDPENLTRTMLGYLDEAGQDMFPSVQKMMEAEDAVKFPKAGVVITDEMRALAKKAEALPATVKAATKAHDALQKVVAPVNKMFAGVYMGWSPGYAFRNWSNNTMQIFIDQGVGALIGSADSKFAMVEELHGGILQGAYGMGGKGLIDEAATKGGTTLKDIAKEVIEKTSLVDTRTKKMAGPAQIAGAKFEEQGAKRILAKTYMDTFERGTKTMVKALTPDLKAAGFSDDIIKRLPTYITEHKGDAQAVINAIRKDINAGVVDVFSDSSRIDAGYRKSLSELGKWDEYEQKVLHAATKEEALTNAKKIFSDIAEAADYVYRDDKMVSTIDDKVLNMFGEGANGLPKSRQTMIARRIQKNDSIVQMAQNILDEADDLANKFSAQTGKAVETKQLKKANNIREMEGWGKGIRESTRNTQEIVNKIYREEMKRGNLADLWKKYPEIFNGPAPANLDKSTFAEALWTRYDEIVSGAWGKGRDAATDGVLGYLNDLKAAGVPVPEKWAGSLEDLRAGAQDLDNAMVGRFGEMVPETRMPYGTRSTQISELANKYGISSATEAGVPQNKKLLSQINKYAEANYKSLEEVPLKTAEEAFARKAGKVTQKEIGLTKAVSVPRSQLPEAASQRFADEAKRLANELSGGEAGRRTAEGATGTTNVSWYRELYKKGLQKPEIDKALNKIIIDNGADKGVNVERMKDMILDIFKTGDAASGTPPDLNVLKIMGADDKTMQEALDAFNDITKQDVTLEEAIRMSGGSADNVAEASKATELLHDPDKPYFDDAGNWIEPKRERILPDPDETPTFARAIHQQKGDIESMAKSLLADVEETFGRKAVVNKVQETALRNAEKELTKKIAETRLISSRVAQEARDFTLLNYGDKTYGDLALQYLYPYHFWYKGTYTNWVKRLASNPAILAHYQRYKANLSNVHADMPEWWRNNINTNDLPGVDVENPLYFNLEATLWPLNGLTGTDFNDPSKRVNWWTYSLDYMNKFGPSTWSPINIATGLALYNQGEKDAGEKWMGRLVPQTATIKAVASKLGATNLELDPLVNAFQGGLDPYERKRVQRALATMEQEALAGKSQYTQAQIQDAAYSQKGPIYEEATKRAVNNRSGSQIASFLFGVGFKGRTKEDMEIDKFYGDYGKLWTLSKGNAITAEEFKQGMSTLKDKYPFMDTVLLSKRDSDERDAGLAYLVMARIPPGSSSKYAQAVDIDPALMEKFYNDKGQIQNWNPIDRQKFMTGIITLSSVLEIPPDVTRKEWEAAKATYSKMNTEAKTNFGPQILDYVDGYYQAKTKSPEAGTAYLDEHPEVEEYMNWKAERVMGSPLLNSYYGGASIVESYYRNQMYKDIETQVGPEIFNVISEYNDIKTFGTTAEQKKYYNQHAKEIKQYYALKDQWQVTIDQKVSEISANIEDKQGATIREDIDVTSPTQQAVVNAVQPQQQMSFQEFQQIMPQHTLNIVTDYISNGDKIPATAQKQLERLAREYGFQDANALVQAIGTSMYQP